MEDILKSIDKSIENLLRRVISLETQDPQYPLVTQVAQAGNLVLTNVLQDLPSATLNLEAGNYLVYGTFYVVGGDAGQTFEGRLVVGGVLNPIIAVCNLEVGIANTITQLWTIQLTQTTTVKLQGRKTGGAGVSTVYATYTTLTALETK